MKKLIYILPVLLLLGCASRHKEVTKTVSSFKYDAQLDTTFNFTKQLQLSTALLASSVLQERNMVIEYDGCAGDSLSVEEFGPGGQLVSKTVIKGKGKSKITSGQKQESHQEEFKANIVDSIDLKATSATKINGDAFTETLDKTVDKTGFSLLSYLWIFILLLILVAGWYLNKRFGLITRAKSHVTKLFF
jgi:hypothetical protein